MTKQKVGGYAWRREVTRARQAICRARSALSRIMGVDPLPRMQAVLVAEAALAVAETMEAIDEIEKFAEEQNEAH